MKDTRKTGLQMPLPMMLVIALATAAVAAAQGTAPPAPSSPAAAAPASSKAGSAPVAQPSGSGIASDPSLEPVVTIRSNRNETVEEARVGDRLVWVKVTPRHGPPYYLIPDSSGGVVIRLDSLGTELRVPQWVLRKF